jgi:hypothetical protein
VTSSFNIRALALSLLVVASLPSVAVATNTVRLTAKFSPNKLGASTSVLMNTNFGTTTGAVPSPVISVNISLPQGVGLGNTTLGEAVCELSVLEERGASGCPPNSMMGFGNATVTLPIGPEPVEDSATVSIFMGKPVNHHTALLFYANSTHPVSDQVVFPGELVESDRHGHILTTIPLTPTIAGAPDASVVHMKTSLGPEHLTYYTYIHGKRHAYQPIGMAEPESCPHGGFRFSATYQFQDGSTVTATSVAPCPHALSHRVGRGRSPSRVAG